MTRMLSGLTAMVLSALIWSPAAIAIPILDTDFGPHAQVENFESLDTTGGGFASPLSLNGNTFSTTFGWIRSFGPTAGPTSLSCFGGAPGGYAPNTGRCIGTNSDDLESMEIVLGTPSIRAGLWVGLTERQSQPDFWSRALVSFFDEASTLLGTVEVYGHTYGFAGWDVGSPGQDVRIARLLVQDIAVNSRVVVIDNLMWEQRPIGVPEPRTLALFCLGLLGLTARRHSRCLQELRDRDYQILRYFKQAGKAQRDRRLMARMPTR